MTDLKVEFLKDCGIDLKDTEVVGKFPYYKNGNWSSVSRGEGWRRYAEWLECRVESSLGAVIGRYLVEAVREGKSINHQFCEKQKIVEGYKKLFKQDYPDCEVVITPLNAL